MPRIRTLPREILLLVPLLVLPFLSAPTYGQEHGSALDQLRARGHSLQPSLQNGVAFHAPTSKGAAPANLPASWMDGDGMDSSFGHVVASAGDVNADGYDDLLVGAPGYGETGRGRAYLYLGSLDGIGLRPAWTMSGESDYAHFGYSVAGAGDVNADGYGDVVIGAPFHTGQFDREGKAYVFLGSQNGLSSTPVWTKTSGQAHANLGYSVAGAGDVNGDVFEDVLVSAPWYSKDATHDGLASLFHGSAYGVEAGASWSVWGGFQDNINFGYSVAGAGDVNGDGYDDLLIGAPFVDMGEPDEGGAFLFYGSPNSARTQVAWSMQANVASAWLGQSVAGAGDINGDGYADVVVGAPRHPHGGPDAGLASTFHGGPSGLGAGATWTVWGTDAGGLFGSSVAGAGDFDRDAYGDVLVGGPFHRSSTSQLGTAALFRGTFGALLTEAEELIGTDAASSGFGSSVAPGGDLNGDGWPDFLVGAPQYGYGTGSVGRAFAYYGGRNMAGNTLMRLDDGYIEPFHLPRHAWSFANSQRNGSEWVTWPESWYRGRFPIYRTNRLFREEPNPAKESDFPDWYTYCAVFGEDYCYIVTTTGRQVSPRALQKWKAIKHDWNGSCYGYALSSILAFDRLLDPSWIETGAQVLGDVDLSDTARAAVNRYFVYQFRQDALIHRQRNRFMTPTEALEEIRRSFTRLENHQALMIFFNGSGHALVPYKIEQDPSNTNQVLIYVYDNNAPANDGRIVTVDTARDTWSFNGPPDRRTGQNWNGGTGTLLPMPPTITFRAPSAAAKNGSGLPAFPPLVASDSLVEVYASGAASVIVRDASGARIGFADGMVVSEMDGGLPITLLNPDAERPLGYLLPQGGYEVTVQELDSARVDVSLHGAAGVQRYWRTDGAPEQGERLSFGPEGIEVRSDEGVKRVNLETIVAVPGGERVLRVADAVLGPEHALGTTVVDGTTLRVRNGGGTGTSYDLVLHTVGEEGDVLVRYAGIDLSTGAAQEIVPVWEELGTTPVEVRTDNDGDGEYEESVQLTGTVTTREQRPDLPTSIALEGNYPNPFNPTTTIRYTLPGTTTVRLEVFDLLGRPVQTLVDEVQGAGSYLVRFDASGLSSGTYLYRLEAGGQVHTKQMTLVK